MPLILSLTACSGGDDPEPGPDPVESIREPTAEDISVQSNLTTPYINIKLIGNDPDNDTLSYVLESSGEGAGYERVFVNPDSGDLYAVLTNDGAEIITIPYKVSDGSLFSNVAEVTITIGEFEEHGDGANEIPADEYGRLELAFYDGDRFGSSLGMPPVSRHPSTCQAIFPRQAIRANRAAVLVGPQDMR